ncbi:hypothetical protein TSAR_007899 [Trichomalopsis sarcophagae]|uniref:Uncharacterized protein n=1 Tax=Trichomalopsis sarcophagae TaxID=543379 RepID=A0A232FM32_9HYME|nr:hypothetical protein TSAR_007899 [Trichomalopsis sarcophagae]
MFLLHGLQLPRFCSLEVLLLFIRKNFDINSSKLYKRKEYSSILLKEHRIDIMNKLRLFDLIENLNIEELNYQLQFLTNIMKNSCGSEASTNGLSLTKSYVRKQSEANKKHMHLSLPDICSGYRIIKFSAVLVHTYTYIHTYTGQSIGDALRTLAYLHMHSQFHRLYKRKEYSSILLKEHRIDIMNNLRLFDLIKNFNIEEPNYQLQFLTNIMKNAWGSEAPANGLSLTKSYVRKQSEANKKHMHLSLPDICNGYRIIKSEANKKHMHLSLPDICSGYRIIKFSAVLVHTYTYIHTYTGQSIGDALRTLAYLHMHSQFHRLYKIKEYSSILLKEHRIDIMNKLRLFDLITNLNIEEPNYQLQFLTNIMKNAWGSEAPANGLSLTKSYVRKQSEANKKHMHLSLPDICSRYRIIKNTLVLFGNLNIKKFRDIPSIDIFQIDKITSTSDGFQDDDIDLHILENFMKIDYFEKLKCFILSKGLMQIYVCKKSEKK